MRNTFRPITALCLFLAFASLLACANRNKYVKPKFSKNYTVVIQDVMATAKFTNADVKLMPISTDGGKLSKANINLTLYNSRSLPLTEKGLDSLARRAIKIFAEPITNLSDFEKIKVCFQQDEQFPKIDPGKRCEYIYPLSAMVLP